MSPDAGYHRVGQLSDAFVRAVEFERHLAFDFEQHADASYSVNTETTVTVGEEAALVELEARVIWRFPDDRPNPQVPFDLVVTIAGVFDILVKAESQDDVEAWLEFNAQHLLWPYLRAAITSITASAGMPPLTIYTIAVPRPRFGVELVEAHEHGEERFDPEAAERES